MATSDYDSEFGKLQTILQDLFESTAHSKSKTKFGELKESFKADFPAVIEIVIDISNQVISDYINNNKITSDLIAVMNAKRSRRTIQRKGQGNSALRRIF